MNEESNDSKPVVAVKLQCGCEYEDRGWMLIRVHECPKHRKQRTMPKPKRAKAECVRAGGKYD